MQYIINLCAKFKIIVQPKPTKLAEHQSLSGDHTISQQVEFLNWVFQNQVNFDYIGMWYVQENIWK